MSEAIKITNEDYLKFKEELDNRNKNTVEKQKEDDFQKTFQELWPNAYNRLNDKETSSSVLLERLKREKHESLIRSLPFSNKNCLACQKDPNTIICGNCHQVCYYKQPPPIKLTYEHDHTCKYYAPAVTHVCTHTIVSPPKYIETPKIHCSEIAYAKLPNLMSSYDLPYFTPEKKEELVKSSYNKDSFTEDIKLLKHIKDDNEKLRFQNKIEKTNDLVDGIINKVSVLQADLKKKAAEVKIKEEMLKLQEDYNRLRRESSLKSILKHRSRSKSPSCSHRGRSTSPVYRLERSKSREDSSSRSKTPNHHHHHYYAYKHENVSSSNDSMRSNRYWKSWKDVPSRVDSWKCTKDSNIY